jgi:hypothetical protein
MDDVEWTPIRINFEVMSTNSENLKFIEPLLEISRAFYGSTLLV